MSAAAPDAPRLPWPISPTTSPASIFPLPCSRTRRAIRASSGSRARRRACRSPREASISSPRASPITGSTSPASSPRPIACSSPTAGSPSTATGFSARWSTTPTMPAGTPPNMRAGIRLRRGTRVSSPMRTPGATASIRLPASVSPRSLSFTPDQLADYFTTQSNVIAAVEGGSEDVGAIREWLVDVAPSLLPRRSALFLGSIARSTSSGERRN